MMLLYKHRAHLLYNQGSLNEISLPGDHICVEACFMPRKAASPFVDFESHTWGTLLVYSKI